MKYQYAPLALGLTLSLVTACGKNGGGGGGSSSQEQQETRLERNQKTEGSYRAILRPINTSLSGYLPTGVAEITITGDQLRAMTLLDDDAKVSHLQNIQLGTKCPTEKSDTNGDGMVDINEAYKVSGQPLIPLDNQLESQSAGGIFPMGSGFTYTQTASVKNLMADLTSGAAVPGLAKLRAGDTLNLAGRVILIHGTASNTSTPIPATVATVNSMEQNLSLPIACGVIVREK